MYTVLETYEGRYLAGGNVSLGSTIHSSEFGSETDYWIIKLNAEGIKVWDNKIIGFNTEYFGTKG